MAETFDSQSVALRAQKKLLGKMATKKIAKVFIDDTSGRLLDNVYRITKEYSGSKKITDKLLKDLIKTVIKIGILYRNEQFTQEELNLADQFKKKFRTLAMTVISFHDLDFSFDKSYICSNLMDCSTMLKQLVENHLTEKSLGRIDNVFTYYGAPEFMEEVFKPTSHLRPTLAKLVEDLNKLLEEHVL